MGKVETAFRRFMLGACYVFWGVLFFAVWPHSTWPQRVVDAMLMIGVGRMLWVESFREPARVICSVCGASDGRKAIPICAECIRPTSLAARAKEREKILGEIHQ